MLISLATFAVGNNVVLPSLTTSAINANCGQSNGSINLSVSPAGSYTYAWSNGATSEDISNLAAGTYNVIP
ncbi:MAG: hypothetical protein IPN89_18555 [Saprospiraceae bacterium]|nr:hypothetical protein [Saprospiraceae bacterium]